MKLRGNMGTHKTEKLIDTSNVSYIDRRTTSMSDYCERYARLKAKYPHLIRVDQPQMFPEILEQFNVCSYHLEEITQVGRKIIDPFKLQLPCVLVTQWVRNNFHEDIEFLPEKAKKAKFLYDMNDVEEKLHGLFKSYLRSVKMPLSLFAKNPVKFQNDFIEETERYRKAGIFGPRFLVNWESVQRHIPESKLKILGTWAADIEQLCVEQGIDDRRCVKLPEICVQWPKGVIPQFWMSMDISKRINCTSKEPGLRYALKDGWARHEIEDKVVTRYTPGPLIGEVRHWRDYAIGATLTVTIRRAIELVGEEALVQASHWNFTTKDIYWQRGTFNADKYQQIYPLPKVP